ncbi:uncharacterized protein TNCV_2759781 [Trichonephila clavipes]|nr:uncharacterized protein TNCV_2759781 [Trichonephila clavipes]
MRVKSVGSSTSVDVEWKFGGRGVESMGLERLISFRDLYLLSFHMVVTFKCYITAAVTEWYRYRIVACLVTSSSPVPLKIRRVGQRCTLNLSRAEMSSHWCSVVIRRGGASSGVVPVT